MMQEIPYVIPVTEEKPRRTRGVVIFLCCIMALSLFALFYANMPRASFPAGEEISIPPGASLTYIAAIFDEEKVVRSAFLFRTVVSYLGGESSIHAGTHIFPEPLTTIGVAKALIAQETSVPPVRITIPEGSTLAEFDAIITAALPHIKAGTIEAMVGKEGVLFPETYFFGEEATAEEVITTLREEREEELSKLTGEIEAHELSQDEIIVLASILEREANDEVSMRMVAGILLDRLKIGMALQVDATLYYLLGKESAELTSEDLEIDSSFNTYLYPGLPPSPIGSPGHMAIMAVLNPTPSPYLYYLTDSEGNFYYAETFEQHKDNKIKYLR